MRGRDTVAVPSADGAGGSQRGERGWQYGSSRVALVVVRPGAVRVGWRASPGPLQHQHPRRGRQRSEGEILPRGWDAEAPYHRPRPRVRMDGPPEMNDDASRFGRCSRRFTDGDVLRCRADLEAATVVDDSGPYHHDVVTTRSSRRAIGVRA